MPSHEIAGTTSTVADYFRAVEDLGAHDETTRLAIARLIAGGISSGDLGTAAATESAPDDLRQEPEPVEGPETTPHFLDPVSESSAALGSELVEIPPDEDAAPTFGSDDILPPLVADRTASAALPFSPLFPPQGQRSILSRTLSVRADSTDPDLPEIVRRVSRAIPLARLPMTPLHTLRRGVQLLIDLGDGMAAFSADRARIGREIRNLAGNVERLRFRESPLDGVMTDGTSRQIPWRPPQAGVPVLIVSDLGMNRWSPRFVPGGTERWIMFFRIAREAGCPLLALVPLDRSDFLPVLARHISLISWDRAISARGSRPVARAASLEPLKQALSLAVRVEPELIRAIRVGLFPELGVSTEARLWEDPDVETRNPMGLVFRADRRRKLQTDLARDSARFEAAWEITESLHRAISPAIRMEEVLAHASLSRQPGAANNAAEMTRRIVATLATDQRETFSRWAMHAALRMTDSLKSTLGGIQLQQGIAARNPDLAASLLAELPEDKREIPAWLRPSDTSESVQAGVRLVDGGFEIGTVSLAGSHPLTLPKMREPWLDLAPAPASETSPVEFHRVHFQLPEGGRFHLDSPAGFIVRTPSGQRFRLGSVKAGLRKAIIVWCGDFTDSRFQPMAAWRHHVDELAAVLKAPEAGGFHSCEIIQDAETSNLRRRLATFYASAAAEDATLLVLGNAFATDDNGEPQLLGLDSDKPLPLRQVREMVSNSSASTHAVIIDCLTLDGNYSRSKGGLESSDWSSLPGGDRPDEWLLRRWRVRPSRSKARSENPFPAALIDALRLGATDMDQNGRISMSELREAVQRRLFDDDSASNSFESHSSSDSFTLAKASVCGLAYDLFVSRPTLTSERHLPIDEERVLEFIRLLRSRLDQIWERPDSVKISIVENLMPNDPLKDHVSHAESSGIFLAFLNRDSIRSKWLSEEFRVFSQSASHQRSNDSSIFAYDIDPASESPLTFPENPSIAVRPLSSENLEAEAHAAAETIAATLLTIRQNLPASSMAAEA